MRSGAFHDPAVVYRSTTAEIAAIVSAYYDRINGEQRAENMRAGTIAGMILNQHRRKKTDKWWTWEDFFADPTQEHMTDEERREAKIEAEARKIMRLFGGGNQNDGNG